MIYRRAHSLQISLWNSKKIYIKKWNFFWRNWKVDTMCKYSASRTLCARISATYWRRLANKAGSCGNVQVTFMAASCESAAHLPRYVLCVCVCVFFGVARIPGIGYKLVRRSFSREMWIYASLVCAVEGVVLFFWFRMVVFFVLY